MEVWKATGANIAAPMLRCAAVSVDESLDAYKRFVENFGKQVSRNPDDLWYANHKKFVLLINTTTAEGLAIWCMHELSPATRMKSQLLLEQPSWSQQDVTLHASIDAAIKRVMRLRKP